MILDVQFQMTLPRLHMNKQSQNKNKIKSSHIQNDHAFYSSIYPTNNAMISLTHSFNMHPFSTPWKNKKS